MARMTLARAGGGPDGEHTHLSPWPLPPAVPLALQVNALQALCRQTFGFRLAMIALAAPFALDGTAPGLGTWLVGSAVLVTFMVSYVLLRDWERFGPVLLRHPALLAADMLFGALLLATATPDSALAYVSICTPLLAGLVYGWRGAALFAVLQSLIIAGAYLAGGALNGGAADHRAAEAGFNALFLPGLCVIAGAAGSTLRHLVLSFGLAGQALTDARARLAAHEAVEEERARLAREMHDSVAKTLHGLAMAAEGLASTVDRTDPLTVRRQAELVARAARRAAAESRELLTDLRREAESPGRGVDVLSESSVPGPAEGVDILAELRRSTAHFGARFGVPTTFRRLGEAPVPPLSPGVARHALTIATEALENARRHAGHARVTVAAGLVGDLLRISVYDDGPGLPPGTSLRALRQEGRFGLVGMVERARTIGARIRIGSDRAAKGTEVRLELPAALLGGGGTAGTGVGSGTGGTRVGSGPEEAP